MRWGALVLAALLLTGCESTQEKSAQLEKAAHHVHLADKGLSITRQSAYVKVLDAQVIHSSQATAAVITLRNSGPSALRDVPIAITVRGAHGNVLFENNAGGIEAALTSVALLQPGAQTVWVDDQVQAAEPPSAVSALVGEGSSVSQIPQLSVSAITSVEGAGGVPAATGLVHNQSTVTQRNLVVYGVARRAGKIVGAGRAIVPELATHQSDKVEIYFTGQTKGAQLQMNAPPTTFS